MLARHSISLRQLNGRKRKSNALTRSIVINYCIEHFFSYFILCVYMEHVCSYTCEVAITFRDTRENQVEIARASCDARIERTCDALIACSLKQIFSYTCVACVYSKPQPANLRSYPSYSLRRYAYCYKFRTMLSIILRCALCCRCDRHKEYNDSKPRKIPYN